MRYATPGAFRTALEQRLLTVAQQAQVPVVRLRKLVVFERLLARLIFVAPDSWLLKGALALDLRFGTRARATKDMDLAREGGEAAATADLLAAQAVALGDYFTFTIVKTGRLAGLEGAAARYHVVAELAGRLFEDAIVDVDFGDALVVAPDLVPVPDLLGFAGIEMIAVPALPLELHVAEKVHAYTRIYAGGRTSSRVKDLVDLALIRSCAAFEASSLQQALLVTFERRGAHAIPAALPPPPPDWGLAYRKMAMAVGLNPDVATGYRLAADFLDPILSGAVPDDARWDPVCHGWHWLNSGANVEVDR